MEGGDNGGTLKRGRKATVKEEEERRGRGVWREEREWRGKK